jgi:hypothetical protein
MANNFGRVNVSISASTGGLTAGLARASKQIRGFQSGVGSLTAVSSALSGMSSALLPVIGGFASAGAALAALSSATHAAEQLHNLSQELGVATGELQVMQQVASETGANQEILTTGLRRTARMVGELAQGTPSAVSAFAQLGLTMQDLAGLSVAQQFELIAARIAALPPQMQAAATVDMFGRSGQGLLTFMRQIAEVTPEVRHLQQVLGVTLSGQQVAAIEAMGDAIGRLSMPMTGFINQFLAELSPAITAVSQIMLEFSTANAERFSFAKLVAEGLTGTIRVLIGIFTVGYGALQMFAGAILGIGSAGAIAFGVVTEAVGRLLEYLGQVIPALSDIGESVTQFGVDTQRFGDALGAEAQNTFMQGVRNFENPLQDFDARMARARQDAAEAAVLPVQTAAQVAGQSIAAAISASSKDLKAIVVGTSEGESFRNSLARGADPRFDVKEESRRTADATEHSADKLDEIATALGANGGFALASISV